MRVFFGGMALFMMVSSIWFGVLAMGGEALHVVSCLTTAIAGVYFAALAGRSR